jgi:hypothetical protein
MPTRRPYPHSLAPARIALGPVPDPEAARRWQRLLDAGLIGRRPPEVPAVVAQRDALAAQADAWTRPAPRPAPHSASAAPVREARP